MFLTEEFFKNVTTYFIAASTSDSTTVQLIKWSHICNIAANTRNKLRN